MLYHCLNESDLKIFRHCKVGSLTAYSKTALCLLDITTQNALLGIKSII